MVSKQQNQLHNLKKKKKFKLSHILFAYVTNSCFEIQHVVLQGQHNNPVGTVWTWLYSLCVCWGCEQGYAIVGLTPVAESFLQSLCIHQQKLTQGCVQQKKIAAALLRRHEKKGNHLTQNSEKAPKLIIIMQLCFLSF